MGEEGREVREKVEEILRGKILSISNYQQIKNQNQPEESQGKDME